MKLAVSNIAWAHADEERVLGVLRDEGISGVEIAPTRIWPGWRGAGGEAARQAKQFYRNRGFSVAAVQSLLYEMPHCRLFGSAEARCALAAHLRLCAEIAGSLGAEAAVFGSPRQRDPGDLASERAFESACEFFWGIAGEFESRGVVLCLEANPPAYDCRFVVESKEAFELVAAVNRAGFQMHLDTGCLCLSGESASAAIQRSHGCLKHFHVSEPYLGGFDHPIAEHASAFESLKSCEYAGWVSLEMREQDRAVESVARAARFLVSVYGGVAE